VAQVKKKRETRTDAVARGDGAFLLEQDKRDVFEVLVETVNPLDTMSTSS